MEMVNMKKAKTKRLHLRAEEYAYAEFKKRQN